VELLEGLGYEVSSREVDYIVDMESFFTPSHIGRIAEKLIKAGYSFRIAERSEQERISTWIGRVFSSTWALEASVALRRDYGGVIIAEKSSEIVGFSTYGSMAPYRFGPIGVHPQHRGLGIGDVLLFKTLEEMKLLGNRYAVIPWTSHLHFYAGVPGIYRLRKFYVYRKKL